jgi:hypothetical protein
MDRDLVRSQRMMKGRVAAQLITFVFFCSYFGWENIDFSTLFTKDIPDLDRKLEELRQLERQQQQQAGGTEKK